MTQLSKLPGFSTIELTPLSDYVGIKHLSASPLTRGDYNKLKGWTMPENENPEDAGYLVCYPDGYISWSPKSTFEEAYKVSGEMSYPMALFLAQTQAHKGAVISRNGWNGKNQYVLVIDGGTLEQGIQRNYGDPSNHDLSPKCPDALFIKTTSNEIFPWTPSAGDQNATDWCVQYV